jgi:hypothetical protein
MKWFRVYSEIKDDPKMLELDDHQRWLWICLMATANESAERGVIQNVRIRGLAAALRTDADRLSEAIALFVDLDMIEYDEQTYTITLLHFTERQYDKPSDTPEQTRDRKARSRQSHADVTPSHATYTDTDTDTYTETEQIQMREYATATPPPPTPAPAPKRAVPKKAEHDPNMDHEAVIAYRDLARLTPNAIQRQDIVAQVRDIERWRRIVREWIAAGWKPGNVRGMLERYAEHGDNGNKRPEHDLDNATLVSRYRKPDKRRGLDPTRLDDEDYLGKRYGPETRGHFLVDAPSATDDRSGVILTGGNPWASTPTAGD